MWLNRSTSAEKHRRTLASQCPSDLRLVLAAPQARKDRQVTFYPMNMAREGWPNVYQDTSRTVEVITECGVASIGPGL